MVGGRLAAINGAAISKTVAPSAQIAPRRPSLYLHCLLSSIHRVIDFAE